MSFILDTIKTHPFLGDLDEKNLALLAESAMPVEFGQGTVIFREGDPANRFYLILEGRVSLEADLKDENNVEIQIVGPGDVLGWSWLFPPYYWHFTARALEPVKAIFFYGTRLRECCDSNPELGFALMQRVARVLINRLQHVRRQLVSVASKPEHSNQSQGKGLGQKLSQHNH